MISDSTVRRTRRENLLSLLGQYSRREICERTGMSTAHVSQLATGQQHIEDVIARQIEDSMKLPGGWMDLRHSAAGVQAAEDPGEALPLEERVLLAKFRQLDPSAKAHVRAIIDAFLIAKRAGDQ